jgi:hypothetical protein
MKVNNPVIDAIPAGQEVTVITAQGQRYTGTDDTSKEDAGNGLFVLYGEAPYDPRKGLNKKTYLRADDVIGFELVYNA